MRLAFAVFQPPEIAASGGIGTYLRNMLPALAELGHDVHLFCSGEIAGKTLWQGCTIHAIGPSSLATFHSDVLAVFGRENAVQRFDAIEGADFGASAYSVQKAFPHIPAVVTLHTPSFLLQELASPSSRCPLGIIARLRRLIATGQPRSMGDLERESIGNAHEIYAPSLAILQAVSKSMGVALPHHHCLPLPFKPSNSLLAADPSRITRKIVFVGRLAERKGLIQMVLALQKVLHENPKSTVSFVGSSVHLPSLGTEGKDYIEEKLAPFKSQVQIYNEVAPSDVEKIIATADIAVFPSHFESFGYVCAEAMAAACGVIVSKETGLAELSGQGNGARLIDPLNIDEIANNILELLYSPEMRIALATQARARVIKFLSPQKIARQREDRIAQLINQTKI